jgi:hypothetical protein
VEIAVWDDVDDDFDLPDPQTKAETEGENKVARKPLEIKKMTGFIELKRRLASARKKNSNGNIKC